MPEEACIRETQEESGLKINLYNPINNQLRNSCELVEEKLLHGFLILFNNPKGSNAFFSFLKIDDLKSK
uniref:NUDIX hydrolase n=1 Tax=Clostridium estertheticum TaxID=238834 RepID=UPI00209AC7C9